MNVPEPPETGTIDLRPLDRAEVLRLLYNSARPQGLGFFHYKDEPMSTDEAKELLKTQTYFDYLHGRVMKVNLGGDGLRLHLYDRDNGAGAGLRALLFGGIPQDDIALLED